MPALNMSLFLSANQHDVAEAVAMGLPAGRVMDSSFVDDPEDRDLRIAFDFDGVLVDDASEDVYQSGGIKDFQDHETLKGTTPHDPGPLRDFLANINVIQRREEDSRKIDPAYKVRVHVSILTARSAPAHERAMFSLKAWGISVNDAFFLGGIEKGKIAEILKPHIFFDDQAGHLEGTAKSAPSVHIPFGSVNRQIDQTEEAIKS